MVADALESRGGRVARNPSNDLLTVNDQWTARVIVFSYRASPDISAIRRFHAETGLRPDFTVGLRMDEMNLTPANFYVIPSMDLESWTEELGRHTHLLIDGYLFKSLDVLSNLAAKTALEVIA